jgi:hypothetical protein
VGDSPGDRGRRDDDEQRPVGESLPCPPEGNAFTRRRFAALFGKAAVGATSLLGGLVAFRPTPVTAQGVGPTVCINGQLLQVPQGQCLASCTGPCVDVSCSTCNSSFGEFPDHECCNTSGKPSEYFQVKVLCAGGRGFVCCVNCGG